MEIEIITREDLNIFRVRLLEDIKQLLKPSEQIAADLLKSKDVKKILRISSGTLQNYRIKQVLHGTRLPGSRTWYYSSHEVNQLKEQLLKK